MRDALGFHITPTTEQPKGRCVCALGLRFWAPGTSFAEKTARRNVAPEHWVFLAGTGGGGLHQHSCYCHLHLHCHRRWYYCCCSGLYARLQRSGGNRPVRHQFSDENTLIAFGAGGGGGHGSAFKPPCIGLRQGLVACICRRKLAGNNKRCHAGQVPDFLTFGAMMFRGWLL